MNSSNATCFFFSIEFLSMYRKSRNKRYYRRHSENNPEHIADTREHIVNVSADNLSSDDEMVDIETTEDQTVEQSIQRSTRYRS